MCTDRPADVCFSQLENEVSRGARSTAAILTLSVEVIEDLMNSTKLGKACDPENLSAEHLKYCHGILHIHLKMLFNAILIHNFVPDDFGNGIMFPLVKDMADNINSVDNYRPITLTPIVSTIFEGSLLRMCESCF